MSTPLAPCRVEAPGAQSFAVSVLNLSPLKSGLRHETWGAPPHSTFGP